MRGLPGILTFFRCSHTQNLDVNADSDRTLGLYPPPLRYVSIEGVICVFAISTQITCAFGAHLHLGTHQASI